MSSIQEILDHVQSVLMLLRVFSQYESLQESSLLQFDKRHQCWVLHHLPYLKFPSYCPDQIGLLVEFNDLLTTEVVPIHFGQLTALVFTNEKVHTICW